MGDILDKNSSAVRKRIQNHAFSDEGGEEYEPSEFGGFGDYFRRKKIKLQNLDAETRATSTKPQIFKGIVAHVSGYTQPPLHVLHKELVEHGAAFLQYLDSKTMATHIVASSLTPKKAVEFSRYRIVKPAWVMDSIRAGKLLPWSDYKVIDEGPRQKTLKVDGGRIFTQSSQQSPLRYREQTQNSFYSTQLGGVAAELGKNGGASPFVKPAIPSSSVLDPDSIEDEDMTDTSPSSMNTPVTHILAPGLTNVMSPPSKQAKEGDALADQITAGVLPTTAEPLAGSLSEEKGGPTERTKPSKPMTSEEHNAWLLSDPHIRQASCANPDFLKQFYSESRLHHLSTWKAELKSRMQRLAVEKGPAPKAIKRKSGARRYVLHVDFDSFFCAVSLKSAPEFADKPAVVAHGSGTGSEIASCNYPAREFGVKNGMWMKKALELCPNLKILPYDFPGYEETSRLFYESVLDVGGVVQSVSVDEALVDATSLVLSSAGSDGVGISEGSIWREQEKADQIGHRLRDEIKRKTGCAVSVGIGANILLAKVALRKAKPAGQYQIKPEEVLDFIGELKVENLPGVAHSISGKLEEVGIKLVKDIRDVSKERLISVLGPKTGEKLWEYARGIDRTEVGEQAIRKSVSAEVNWGIRFISQEEAEEFVHNLCKELQRRLLNEHVRGKNLTMKIMRRSLDAPLDPAKHLGHGQCDTFNKSVTFGVATNDAAFIGREAVAILRSFKFSPGDLRGLGVQLTKLEPIKVSSAAPEGSQRKLTFGTFASPASAKKGKTDPIEDELSPQKPKAASTHDIAGDPIAIDPLTPKKPRASPIHPALVVARANEADDKARTPLNMTGTQFIMPSNPDPEVLAELPQDIRRKLMGQGCPAFGSRQESPTARSRTQSPALPDIPPNVDPDVFHALPDDVKAEILASYRRKTGQTVLQQSPRRDRIIQLPKKSTTPTKRGGIRGMFGRARERQQDAAANLLQTSFLPATRAGSSEPQAHAGDEPDELDPEFLAELPEDMRREVIEDHRRRRLAKRGGLNVQRQQQQQQQQRNAVPNEDVLAGGQTRLQFPAPPPKVTFTASSMTSVAEIKDMLSAWHRETQRQGPHRADADMFGKYLGRVVLEERDLEKAVKIVKWLGWLVEEDEAAPKGRRGWKEALDTIKDQVQGAAMERGLGTLDMG